MPTRKKSVVVLYNHSGEDEYENLRSIDPNSLDFKPEYDIHVATVKEEYHSIVDALNSEGYDARPFNILNDLERLLDLCRNSPPDVIFNLVEFFHDQPELESAVAGLFELYQIPYTGSRPFSLSLCQRKGLTKRVLLEHGVATPRFKSLSTPRVSRRHGLHYPLIVKPAREDASSGVDEKSVVRDYPQLTARLNRMFDEFEPPILIEEFIEGRELHASVLGNDPPSVLPLIEFDFSDLPEDQPRIITYDVKWNPLAVSYHRVHSLCPASLAKRTEKRVQKLALAAYKATSCRDYARIDIRLSNNKPYVLEVNPNPDLTEGVSFMDSAEQGGLTFSETLKRIVEFAIARSPSP